MEQARKKDHKFDITETAINKITLINTPLLSEEQNLSLMNMNKYVLRIAKQENNSNEIALISTYTFKQPYIKVLGTENRVNYYDDINVKTLKRESYAMELIMTHNHPATQNFSFADIAMFIIDEYLGTLSVVTNQGQVFIIQKSTNFDYFLSREMINTLIDKYALLIYPKNEERQQAAAHDFIKKFRRVGIWYGTSK